MGVGDRILLDPGHTGLAALVWAEVEIVAFVPNPTTLPWNTGCDFPYRVGYSIPREPGDAAPPQRGTLWLSRVGSDLERAVRRIEHQPS
ncbi:hypothetical protein E3T61_06990 [Cryobacterium lactosi]|uniref:Uncharacterized protein n=1 Tax=Cryobacterium lactosi TaxID=1259202 RepID=A0A4R9BW34_9MICO|nr:hypothetical protein [Cryobacterium lactosi]TFD92054.1 hypothetical protein E3T61_06990 [Cryobacterium lactosi]